jgi:O-antigen ligase
MLWGLTVFMPVGATYAAAVLLLAALLGAGGLRDRAARVRANPLWWPIVAYVAWTLIVLAIGRHYPQTGSNLGHGLRIAATALMAMALTRDEAVWALRGFWLIGLLNLVLIAIHFTVGLPVIEVWRGILMPVGNKSISNALLFTIMGATAAVQSLYAIKERRYLAALPGFALVLIVALIITVTLTSRTSLLALVVAIAAACVHKWRKQLEVLAVAIVVVGAIAAVGIWNSPGMQQKFELGMQELEAAQTGTVSEGSWVVRYYMYRDTARMIADRPLTGWGIGGWTEQWHLRGPKLLADYNMPHNDFLWMGSQAGIPGSLSLLAIILTGVWMAWRREDIVGRRAFVAVLVLLIATSLNSALRDAQIGLSILWVTMVYLRLVQEPGDPWRELLPRRIAERLSGGAPPPRPL